MLFVFLIISFSITNAIVNLHVFAFLRKLICGLYDEDFFEMASKGLLTGFRESFLGRLFHCHACMGFWVGVLLSYRHGGFIVEYIPSIGLIECIIMDGVLVSGFNFVVWLILIKLGAKEL